MLTLNELIIATEVGLIYGILALGIYFTFRTINFPDLTCDGSFVTGAAVSSVMIKSGVNPMLGIFLAVLAGGIAGFLTGLINIRLKVEDLLSGIIVAFMLYSINLRIMETKPNISLVNESTIFRSDNSIIICMLIVVFILFFIAYLLSSDFGLGLRAIGQNKKFASANGINVNAMTIFGLIISNALIAMCGAIFTQYQGFCDVSQGTGCLVVGLASVITGEKFLPKIKFIRNLEIKSRNFIEIFFALFSCVIGSIAYRIFIAIAINSDIFGLKTQDLNLITGLLIIFIMSRKQKC
jgi:putative ABC transport system permease protein